MPLRASFTSPHVLIQLLIALLQGAFAWLLQTHDYYQDAPPIAGWAALPPLLVAGLSLWLLGPRLTRRDVWPWALLLAALCGAMSAWACQQERDSWDSLSPVFYIASITFFGLTGLAFLQAHAKASPPRYADLAHAAWSMVSGLLHSLVIVGAYWIVLSLWAALFETLGYPLFDQLFYQPAFAWMSSALVLNLALRLNLEQTPLVDAQRVMLRNVCRWLLPLATLVTLLFVAALPFAGLQPLWHTGYSSSILLGLLLINLLLVNGLFQDGQGSTPYPRLLDIWVRAGLYCLPVLAAVALYGLYLRTNQHGLTPYRYIGLLLATLALAYTLALAWANRRGGNLWLTPLRRSNPILAVLGCLLVLAVHTPWLNAPQVSAWHQYRLMLSGQQPPKYADIGYLKYRLGEPGKRYLARLEADYPQAATLSDEQRAQFAERFERVQRTDNYYQALPETPEEEAELASVNFQWIGPAITDAERLRSRELVYLCRSGCMLSGLDIDGDGRPEILVIPTRWDNTAALLYRLADDGKLHALGQLIGSLSSTQLIEGLRAGTVSLRPQRYLELHLGDKSLRPVINEY